MNSGSIHSGHPPGLDWLLWNVRHSLFLLLLPTSACAQTLISARVLDADTQEPLPYCSIAITGSTRGTITNADGDFRLRVENESDTIRFSYVGYVTLSIPVRDLIRQREVLMRSSSTQLREVEVFPNDELYERVVRAGRALRTLAPYVARTYFELGTHLGDRPVEVVEAFHNARFKGGRITALDLKHGRIGMAPVDGRYFVNLNTSKAMVLFDPAAGNAYFPDSPLQWGSVRQLRRAYTVELVSSGDAADPVDHLHLTPRDSSAVFKADLWLNGTTDEVQVLELACAPCGQHPFVPLWDDQTIERVDMRLRQTWGKVNGRQVLSHLELDLLMDYSNDVTPELIDTKAVLHVFDPGGAFILPLFDYDSEQPDYRKITFQPYDSSFWATAPMLVRTARQQNDVAFLSEHGLVTGMLPVQGERQVPLFESNYAWWAAGKRISLKTLPSRAIRVPDPRPGRRGSGPAITQVNLRAQIYLDIDTANGTARHFSATAFDGFRSYYHLPPRSYTNAFINLFFDLCEMERRNMEERISDPALSLDRIRQIHAEATTNMDRTSRSFIRETHLGADRPAMERWNQRVREALGIDNLILFGL